MEKNLFGIVESDKVGSIIATLISSIRNLDSNKDNNVSTMEILNALQLNAFKIISDKPNLELLRQEATDYSEAEKDTLAANIAAGLNIAKRKASILVERGMSIVLDLADFIIDLRKDDSFFKEETDLVTS